MSPTYHLSGKDPCCKEGHIIINIYIRKDLINIYIKYFQNEVPVCYGLAKKCAENCVEKMDMDDNICLHNCQGLLITSYSKSNSNTDLKYLLPKTVHDYRKYKKWSKFMPEGIVCNV